MKLLERISIQTHQEAPTGFLIVNWSLSKAPNLLEAVRQWPGVRWSGSFPRGWLVPQELEDRLRILALEHGLSVPGTVEVDAKPRPASQLQGRHEYQVRAAEKAVAQNGLLINFDTGLGKSTTAILALQRCVPKRTLIICPAVVRRHWRRELEKWWPAEAFTTRNACPESSSARSPTVGRFPRPAIRVIETAKDWGVPSAYEIVICSYELVPEAHAQWDAIVLDESHYIKDAEASRSVRIKKHCHMNSKALKLCLTATPIANEPMDLWNQVHCLWPGRFGSFGHFLKRYAKKSTNDFGSKWGGLNEDTAMELRERVAGLSAQATRQQYAHLLPRFTTESLYVPALKKHRFNWLADPKLLDKHLEATADAKLQAILETITTEASSVAVLTYRIAYAKELADKLGPETGKPTFLITGEQSHKERDAILQAAANTPGCILVASMKSIGIGIDLNGFSLAYFLELYYSPAVMLQALGRFSRLSGTESTKVTFVIAQGTLDESVATALEAKLLDINAAVGSTAASDFASKLSNQESEDDFRSRLREIAATQFSGFYA